MELPEEEREKWLSSLSNEAKALLRYKWRDWWARPNQLAPLGITDVDTGLVRPFNTWLVMAGRGFGKTRIGSEWIRENVCGATPLAPPPIVTGKHKGAS